MVEIWYSSCFCFLIWTRMVSVQLCRLFLCFIFLPISLLFSIFLFFPIRLPDHVYLYLLSIALGFRSPLSQLIVRIAL